jgi:hypothetical protein
LRKCKRLILNGDFESIWIRSPFDKYEVTTRRIHRQTETKLTLKVRGENVSITRHFH